jgi:hypothetical protein
MNGLNTAQSYEPKYPEIFYASYNRQYHESYGAGHDGNPPHRVASVRREEIA